MIPDRFERLAAARLYLVCGELTGDRLDAALLGGVQLVQLRLKGSDPDHIVEVGRRFADACSRRDVPLILNDHPELVAAAGADGVHVGQDDLPVGQARELAGSERIVGLSTHNVDQIVAAGRLGVDYIGVGPVHTTPTKPGRAAVGAELVTAAARHAPGPFFAIGGINTDTVAAVVAAGARRVAVVRAIAEADDPERAARRLRSALEAGVRVGAA
ncbi:MAG TPA: thiamine phosphate synthase [Solirubrobacteraceae bacterium]|nr:thiamine phosphate synthase [Solirubrobacteraceae bacterium]